MEKKRTILSLQRRKDKGEKIVALTAYDFPTARLLDEAGLDLILVGDSLGMVIQGHDSTLTVTLDDVLYHARLVRRAVQRTLLVADMPYGSYHLSPRQAVKNGLRLVKEAQVDAVKVEGGRRRIPAITALLEAEIPVMGHIGLTPQSVHRFGGYRIQGRTMDEIRLLVDDALALQAAGCFSLVLEGIPHPVGRVLTRKLRIPTIGIGAGPACDGQILVFHDMMGLDPDTHFKFVRRYADLAGAITEGLTGYLGDVRQGTFPSLEESFPLETDIEEELERLYGSDLEDQQA